MAKKKNTNPEAPDTKGVPTTDSNPEAIQESILEIETPAVDLPVEDAPETPDAPETQSEFIESLHSEFDEFMSDLDFEKSETMFITEGFVVQYQIYDMITSREQLETAKQVVLKGFSEHKQLKADAIEARKPKVLSGVPRTNSWSYTKVRVSQLPQDDKCFRVKIGDDLIAGIYSISGDIIILDNQNAKARRAISAGESIVFIQ